MTVIRGERIRTISKCGEDKSYAKKKTTLIMKIEPYNPIPRKKS